MSTSIDRLREALAELERVGLIVANGDGVYLLPLSASPAVSGGREQQE